MSLVPEMAASATALSRLAARSDSMPGPSIGHVPFGFDLMPSMAIGVAVLGLEFLVGAWDAGAAPVSVSGLVPPTFLVGKAGDVAG